MRINSLLLLVLFTTAVSATESDPAIGKWDGVTQEAALQGPYEDPMQAEIPFGRRSYYLTPWRAYMDTWPSSRLLECLGVNFNVDDAMAPAMAQLLGECGIRSARVEISWGNFSYDAPDKLQPHGAKRFDGVLKALKANGIRPLILLNGNSGAPCPLKMLRTKLLKDAPLGATEIFLEKDKLGEIKTGYTGLRGQEYPVACPLILSADAESGRCQLSAPLKKDVKAGAIDLWTLRYAPLGGAILEDGKNNDKAQETIEGWKTYVAEATAFVKTALGTEGAEDAGFDIEVWNEYSFGSQFLNEDNYYRPKRKFKEPLSYSNHGRTQKGSELLLPLTVDYVNDPKNKLPGVNVINGFSNQRPWDNGAEMWPGQAGFSRHYYTNANPGDWDGGSGLITPQTEKHKTSGPLNALGKPDGTSDHKDWHTVVAGSFFIPMVRIGMPEMWHYGYKTELMSRDLQPFPNPMKNHFRYGHPADSRPAEVWMSEFNLDREPFAKDVMKRAGVTKDDVKLAALLHRLGAKALLRSFVFHSHKGLHTIDVFAVKENDSSLAVVPEQFFKTLKDEKFALTDKVREQLGPQLAVVKRVAEMMKSGKPIETARPLNVSRLIEHQPRLVFKGDGTPEHPDRFHRDDFAVLPFQLDEKRFAIGYYVVTRDMTHEWNPEREVLDPQRYDMPDQTFDLSLENLCGEGAKISAWDPLTDKAVPATLLEQKKTGLTAQISACDYPRFLIVDEREAGPLILNVKAGLNPGAPAVTFSTNLPMGAMVSWGPLPERSAGGSKKIDPATQFEVTVPAVAAGSGVRISVEHNGLIARWPLWGHDVLGQGK